jgi:antitoxin (DNA-binding transcriptional repressor) of toxin-antitoxin stability system
VKEITLSVTEASRGFSDPISRVHYRGESATLIKNGKAVARVVPVVRALTGAELAKRWKSGAHLSPKEADAFARDIEKGRRFFKPYVSPWD